MFKYMRAGATAICCVLLSLVGVPVASAAQASTLHTAVTTVTPDLVNQTNSGQFFMICYDVPPDYPGCTPAQVRPRLNPAFHGRFTGRAGSYRYFLMGQPGHGHTWKYLTAAENRKAIRMYNALKNRTAMREGVSPQNALMFDFWSGLRSHAVGTCFVGYMQFRYTDAYCSAFMHYGAGTPDHTLDKAFSTVTHFVSRCNGALIGGVTAGGVISFWTGPGVIEGGLLGGAGGEISCQATNVYSWAMSIW